ncbi:23S rRNA pseudouridine(1911/1915/1917) synthase RluD [Luminiphilus sp.]|jgi:23S rRNA pseudouridine1911/1915/1917 synthase|nr:23S rRNA pseudouridine(1911/1915/1917) synthase RluD [Luminiphilus sp.]MDA8662788.1 23S rRNA pseudouridine(1911/1915/1917) synthase RluD [Luminiphilus sp.]MDA9837372.1 23S rRNA pseudouridine(1911/1915/1917) synthase RluD [Luminiphilus sp.]MDB2432786.1 23S rRNA pseudouridine(1911/1915/1917) synthase RluD [Luminiphilus sp.]MDB3933228.1 23S rRNA pseudouridine(1911/1915/1917) synthase RluD [Luminiphilus sp.]
MSVNSKNVDLLEARIPIQSHGMRLDQVVAELFPDYSRNRLATWIKEGRLTVDGKTMKPRDKALASAHVVLEVADEPVIDWQPQTLPLDVIFEDEHILVVNKPAGMVVHPAAGHTDGTLVNALLGYAPELDTLPRGGIVHRLDKETSGIMFVARSALAHKSLVAQLSERTVSRTYCAVCTGALTGGGKIDAPIDRHPTARTKMAVVADGKPAVTHYRIAHRFKHYTQLQVNLETGRTHQIRVHMAHRKWPLIGDPVYAGRQRIPAGASEALITALRNFPRQALHAQALEFEHPATGDWMEFETELPDDLVELLEVLDSEDRFGG